MQSRSSGGHRELAVPVPGPGSRGPRRLPSARQRGSAAAGNTMQGFFCAALSGFVLQLCSLDVSV